MDEEKKFDKKGVGFVVGGAVLGAIAGYLVKKIGIKNWEFVIYVYRHIVCVGGILHRK